MKRTVIGLLLSLPTLSCTTAPVPDPAVHELSFFADSHQGCSRLALVEATGPTQEIARARLLKRVVEVGGNAVVFHGARAKRDPETGELTPFTELGIAYACTEAGEEPSNPSEPKPSP